MIWSSWQLNSASHLLLFVYGLGVSQISEVSLIGDIEQPLSSSTV